jgi:predicted DNA-binding transcriptional regulator YafY
MPAAPNSAKKYERGAPALATLRMIRMLRLVPRQPGKTTAGRLLEQLAAQEYPISRRSVERDLQTLRDAGLLESDEAPQNRGWFVPRDGQALHVADMTAAEALALHMGGKYLSGILPPAVQDEINPFLAAAERVLKNEWGSRRAAWRNKVAIAPADQPLLPPDRNRAVEAVVYRALLEGRQLDVRYGKKDTKERCVHPLGLVQRGPVTYLVVRYEGFADVRILALHRIRSAAACLGEALPPPGFTLEGYLAQGGFGFHGSNEKIRLTLKIGPALQRVLEETPLAEDQRIDVGPTETIVSATVLENAVLKRWLLSWGSEVQVLAPDALRASVMEALRQAAAGYA